MKMIRNPHNILKLAAFGAFYLSVTSGALPPTEADCTGPDPFLDPDNCTCYYTCFDVPDSGWMLVHFCCPIGGHYDDRYKSCSAGDCAGDITTTQPTTDPPAFTCTSVG